MSSDFIYRPYFLLHWGAGCLYYCMFLEAKINRSCWRPTVVVWRAFLIPACVHFWSVGCGDTRIACCWRLAWEGIHVVWHQWQPCVWAFIVAQTTVREALGDCRVPGLSGLSSLLKMSHATFVCDPQVPGHKWPLWVHFINWPAHMRNDCRADCKSSSLHFETPDKIVFVLSSGT